MKANMPYRPTHRRNPGTLTRRDRWRERGQRPCSGTPAARLPACCRQRSRRRSGGAPPTPGALLLSEAYEYMVSNRDAVGKTMVRSAKGIWPKPPLHGPRIFTSISSVSSIALTCRVSEGSMWETYEQTQGAAWMNGI